MFLQYAACWILRNLVLEITVSYENKGQFVTVL